MFALHPASDRKRSSGFATGDVQDTAPVPVHEPVGASCETVAELPVQAVSLPALHGDMPGERVQQLDVALGVVDGLSQSYCVTSSTSNSPLASISSRWRAARRGAGEGCRGPAPRRSRRRRAGLSTKKVSPSHHTG